MGGKEGRKRQKVSAGAKMEGKSDKAPGKKAAAPKKPPAKKLVPPKEDSEGIVTIVCSIHISYTIH
jgi:hypothetical protein